MSWRIKSDMVTLETGVTATDSIDHSGNLRLGLLLLLAFLISVIKWSFELVVVRENIAVEGFSIFNLKSHLARPDSFARDWPNAILDSAMSGVISLVIYLDQFFEGHTLVLLSVFIFLQIFLFTVAVGFLAHRMFKDDYITVAAVFFSLLSTVASLNLARLGSGYGTLLGYQLLWGFPLALKVLAVCFFLTGQYVASLVFLALCVYCHVNAALCTAIFFSGYLLCNPRLVLTKRFLFGVLAFVILILPLVIKLTNSHLTGSAAFPAQEWVQTVKIFSVHHFPVTNKLFTTNAKNEVWPLLWLIFFFVVALRYADRHSDIVKIVVLGMVACVVASALHILFSEIWPVPFLIRLQLHRCSDFVSFFSLLFILAYLKAKITSGSLGRIFLAVSAALTFLFCEPGVPLLALWLLLISDVRDGFFGPFQLGRARTVFVWAAYCMLVVFVLISFLNELARLFPGAAPVAVIRTWLWTPLLDLNPLNQFDLLIFGGRSTSLTFLQVFVAALGVSIAVWILRESHRWDTRIALPMLATALLLCFIFRQTVNLKIWQEGGAPEASSYLSAQIWARDHTPPDALFLIDPSFSNGWRDFSERPSFGNLREWLFYKFSYFPDYELFLEGRARAEIFGIDIRTVDLEKCRGDRFLCGQVLQEKLRKYFYSMNYDDFLRIRSRYGVDYVVLLKKYLNSSISYGKPVYENCHFVIVKL